MPEVSAVHFAIDLDHSPTAVITALACNEFDLEDVEYTRDPDDTTCNNCLRALEYARAKVAKHG